MLLRDETHAYPGHRNTPSRCPVRLHLPAEGSGHDALLRTEDLSRVVFAGRENRKGSFDYLHGTTLGKPDWKHPDRQSVQRLIDCHLP